MHDAQTVRVVQRLGHAQRQTQHQGLGQQAARLGVARQVVAGHELHGQPGQPTVNAGIPHANDARMHEPAGHTCGIQEADLPCRRCDARGHHGQLHGHRRAAGPVFRKVDLAMGTAAYELLQAVASHRLAEVTAFQHGREAQPAAANLRRLISTPMASTSKAPAKPAP